MPINPPPPPFGRDGRLVLSKWCFDSSNKTAVHSATIFGISVWAWFPHIVSKVTMLGKVTRYQGVTRPPKKVWSSAKATVFVWSASSLVMLVRRRIAKTCLSRMFQNLWPNLTGFCELPIISQWEKNYLPLKRTDRLKPFKILESMVSIDNHGATLPHIPPKGHVRSHDDVTTLMYVLVI